MSEFVTESPDNNPAFEKFDTGSVEAELRAEREYNAFLEENWREAALTVARLQAEDNGWSRYLNNFSETDVVGFTLDHTKEIAKTAELQCVGNPLLKRGFTIRRDNVFGKGLKIEGDIKPRDRKKIFSPRAERIVTSASAFDMNESHLYKTGNLFIGWNRSKAEPYRFPIYEITGSAANPDDENDTWYYQRTYNRMNLRTGKSESVTVWHPTLEAWEAGDVVGSIGGVVVDVNTVIIDVQVNKPTTATWGIPDAFAALAHAKYYSDYQRDARHIIDAQATVAWQVRQRSQAGAAAAGATMAGAGRRRAATASYTEGGELKAISTAGNVDMTDGDRVASMVAAALEVPLYALLSTSENSYGSAAALDKASIGPARARQELWVSFYERLFRAMGVKDVTVSFPKLSEDPIHRQIASLAAVRATGGLWADEYRATILEALDVAPLHTTPPPVEEYAQAQNAISYLSYLASDVDPNAPENDPLARRGNTGVAPGLSSGDNTNRDQEHIAGTGSVDAE